MQGEAWGSFLFIVVSALTYNIAGTRFRLQIYFSDILAKYPQANQLDSADKTDNTNHTGPSADSSPGHIHDDRPDHSHKA